jgi:exonuclease III
MVVALIWNSRGLNRPDKLARVHDLIRDTCPDIIGFSETKKEEFNFIQLQQLDPMGKYSWNWLPAKGTARGILVGINKDLFDICRCDIHTFSVVVLLKNKSDGVVWRFISVYGSAYDEHKLEFINELHNTYASWNGPTLVGGDFNLIHESKEKNNGNINQHWANMFNDWINKFALIEIKNSSRQFT